MAIGKFGYIDNGNAIKRISDIIGQSKDTDKWFSENAYTKRKKDMTYENLIKFLKKYDVNILDLYSDEKSIEYLTLNDIDKRFLNGIQNMEDNQIEKLNIIIDNLLANYERDNIFEYKGRLREDDIPRLKKFLPVYRNSRIIVNSTDYYFPSSREFDYGEYEMPRRKYEKVYWSDIPYICSVTHASIHWLLDLKNPVYGRNNDEDVILDKFKLLQREDRDIILSAMTNNTNSKF